MCDFFSAISNGRGVVRFFTIEDIVNIMAHGNKEQYDFNSHSSIATYFNLNEDKWNKWEFKVDEDKLQEDMLNTKDDSSSVGKTIKAYLKGKEIVYLKNMYNMNSGDRNSGNMNSGDMNSGYRNSGYMNSGDRNSGDRNSGNMNSGDMNSGDMNSGNRNSGNRNSGYMNSGDRNSGDRNSGNMNSGYRNSGNMNSGDRNSGNMNSGNMNSGATIGSFCTKETYYLFNKKCTKKDHDKIYNIGMDSFVLNKFVDITQMSAKDKKEHLECEVIGGYLKTIDYKEAWSRVSKPSISKIKELKNFDKKIFHEISGINS